MLANGNRIRKKEEELCFILMGINMMVFGIKTKSLVLEFMSLQVMIFILGAGEEIRGMVMECF